MGLVQVQLISLEGRIILQKIIHNLLMFQVINKK
jgi:hypothetical protein